MPRGLPDALRDRYETGDRVVEIGIGRRTDAAVALADTHRVLATDIEPRPVPSGVEFVVDDVTAPRLHHYRGATVVYAQNLPRELHRPVVRLADRLEAGVCFTTLGADFPAVPAEAESLEHGWLYWPRNHPA